MIKICHFSSVHLYNDTRILYRECASLAEEYDVTLVITGTHNQIIDGVKIRGLKRYTSRILRLLVTVPSVFFNVLKVKANILHFHDPELIGIAFLFKLMGKKVIIDIHEDYSQTFAHKSYLPRPIGVLLQYLYKKILIPVISKFDVRIVAWPMIGEKLKHSNIDSTLIRNFPKLEYFPEHIENRKLSDETLQFVYTGLISEERGIEQILDFIMFCEKEDMVVSLDIYGRFSNEKIKTYFDEQTLNSKNIKYKGWIGPKELFDVLFQYDFGFIFFHPIPNHMHSQPNKLFEYWAANVIPLTSNLPMLTQFIQEAKSGIAFNIFELEKQFPKIKAMIEKENWRKQNMVSGRNAVFQEYNWEKESDILKTVYKNLIT